MLRRAHELMPDNRLDEHARAAASSQNHVEYADVDEPATFDALIINSPTRFGNRAAQMSQFLDQTGRLWRSAALIRRPSIVPLGYVADELQATRTDGPRSSESGHV